MYVIVQWFSTFLAYGLFPSEPKYTRTQVTYRQARREGVRRGHCPGARGSKLSGLECKIHQLKLRPADAMMFFGFWAEI